MTTNSYRFTVSYTAPRDAKSLDLPPSMLALVVEAAGRRRVRNLEIELTTAPALLSSRPYSATLPASSSALSRPRWSRVASLLPFGHFDARRVVPSSTGVQRVHEFFGVPVAVASRSHLRSGVDVRVVLPFVASRRVSDVPRALAAGASRHDMLALVWDETVEQLDGDERRERRVLAALDAMVADGELSTTGRRFYGWSAFIAWAARDGRADLAARGPRPSHWPPVMETDSITIEQLRAMVDAWTERHAAAARATLHAANDYEAQLAAAGDVDRASQRQPLDERRCQVSRAREVTHHGGRQIVSRDTLRRVLREDGESCFCAPWPDIEWDAGECPQHAETVYCDGSCRK